MDSLEKPLRQDTDYSANRYEIIERNNRDSFLMNEPSKLDVIHSLHSAGDSRDFTKKAGEAAFRLILSGNMSPLNSYGPTHLTTEGRIQDAQENVASFLQANNIQRDTVRLLAPERDYTTPLTCINLDTATLEMDDSGLLKTTQKGDFIYTFNPDIALAARPADCPVAYIAAETPDGEVSVLLHLAWLGVAHGYVEQAREALDTLAVDWNSMQVRLSAGAHAASYKYSNYASDPRDTFPVSEGLFLDIAQDPKIAAYSFSIDVAAATYESILEKWDVTPYQVFMDTTDTASAEAGYSSHSRTFKNYSVGGENSRDIVIARRANNAA